MIQWLEGNIVCTNKVRMGKSMITHVGRGTLANHGVVVGYMVRYIPLIHITNRYLIKIHRDEFVMTTK